ncbi:MAG TPA: heat-inducible transcriptional repressor HrcA [Acidimicrobiales bacterium]|nr:heat-inducible transcriptional repressor HrcA [Acidimicrobiales bacterium]
MADQHTRAVTDEEPELDDRKTAILNAIVAEHIETAQPVGSGHLTEVPGVEVSSATVRSEMAALERDGYLAQPHTSAGRIPTDKGYRFFVDHLAGRGVLDAAERQEVRRFFAQVHGEVEELLGQTSGLLANLTDYAAVVVGPSHDAAAIRAVQLVGLSPRVALLVLVLLDGTVGKRTLELSTETQEAVLVAAAAHLTTFLKGSALSDFLEVPSTNDDSVNAVVQQALDAIVSIRKSEEPDHVFVGGSSRMAAAFDAVETVRSVLSILEQQLVVVELIEDILERGLSVAIGREHGFEPLSSCALVVGPYEIEGQLAGAIGVLGPTRMNYPKAMAAVRVVGAKLGERLGGQSSRGEGGDREHGVHGARGAHPGVHGAHGHGAHGTHGAHPGVHGAHPERGD